MISKALAPLLAAALVLLAGPVRSATAPLPKGPEIQVSAPQITNHWSPSVAVFPDGGFVVVWTVGPWPGHKVIHARLFGADGKPTTGEFLLGDKAAGSQFADQVVADGNGSFLVVWTEEKPSSWQTDVFVRRFNRKGTALGPRIEVSSPRWAGRSRGVLALGSKGRFAVAWSEVVPMPDEEASYANALVRIFTAAGTPVAGEFFLVGVGAPGIGDDNIYAFPTGLALGTDGSLVTLVQNYYAPSTLETWLTRINPDRTRLEQLRLDPIYNCCSTNERGSSLAMGRDGRLLAAWSEWEITAQRFDRDGTPRGKRLSLSKSPLGLQVYPSVGWLAGGGFLVAWSEGDGRDGDADGIFGRVFAANATPLTEDFRINATTAGSQYGPVLGVNRNGQIVVVWWQQSADGRTAIVARLLR